MTTTLRAPFPYFGGKSGCANLIWSALGDVGNYAEPFAGSLAVLLARPHTPRIETVNDTDCHIANFWRAVKQHPDTVAEHANWPINEADYIARLRFFKSHTNRLREQVLADPNWCNPKMAGWWVWGQSTAICGNWPRNHGVHLGPPTGIHAHSHNPAKSIPALAERLRNVRVMCGDFERALKTTRWKRLGIAGAFLDPPRSEERRVGKECRSRWSPDH